MSINTQNKLLRDAATAVEAKLTPETRQAYDKIVVSGMQVALNKGLEGMMAGLEKRGDPIRDAAQGAVNLVFMLRAEATGRMPEQAMVPASYTLLLQALSFIEEAKIAEIDRDTLTKATKTWTNTVFDRFRISPAMLNRAKESVDGVMNDPFKMEMLNLATGYTKDPRAPQPLGPVVTERLPMNRRERRRERRAAVRAGSGR